MTGSYWNVNFLNALLNYYGIPNNAADHYVRVAATASVQALPGFPNWGVEYEEDYNSWDSFSWAWPKFLSPYAYGYAYEDCNDVCEPTSYDLWSCENSAGTWDYLWCRCHEAGDPLVIDLDKNGFDLTDVASGVTFDILASGVPVKTAWTRGPSQDAFLVLDRNNNGLVDDGTELFSDVAPQPAGPVKKNKSGKRASPNGFTALSLFDALSSGGNNDNQISDEDPVYSFLRLWIDANHDGRSAPAELWTLADKGVRSISLYAVAGKETDQFGNRFGFRSRATMDRDLVEQGPVKRAVVDVFFQYAPVSSRP